MQPYALHPHPARREPSHATTAPLTANSTHDHHRPQTVPFCRDLPAVTDWTHFANWCRQHGRQALPATDETLTLYFRDRQGDKKRDPAHFLGWLALATAILAVLSPAASLFISSFAFGLEDTRLGFLVGGLGFTGFQVVALGSGWASRNTAPGRAGWAIACLSTLLALGVGYFIVHFGGLPAIENQFFNQ